MKSKIVSIILIIVALSLIVSGIVVHYKWHVKKQDKESDVKEEIPSGVDYDENIEDWRSPASIETMNLISEIYPEDHEFQFSVNNKFNISLAELQSTTDKNFNIYSKYGVECDLEKSEFVVELDYNTKEQTRLLNLDCQPISKARSTPVKTVN